MTQLGINTQIINMSRGVKLVCELQSVFLKMMDGQTIESALNSLVMKSLFVST